MFGFGRKFKEVIVEEVVPPTYSSAAVELVREFLAPVKNYVPSTEDRAAAIFVVFASVLLISAAFLLLREPPASSASAAVVEEENEVSAEEEASAEAMVVTEEIPKEVGDESSQVESIELTAASSSSSSNTTTVSDSEPPPFSRDGDVLKLPSPPGNAKELAPNDVVVKPLPSEDEVSALGTASKDSSDENSSPPPALPEAKAVSVKPPVSPSVVAAKPVEAKASSAASRPQSNFQKAKSSNSLGRLKRSSMKKLKSVKKIFN